MKPKSLSTAGIGGLQNFLALSVWEISHRWHSVDPNTSDPKNLPLPVQDTLRALCSELLVQGIPASTRNGDDFGILSDAPTLSRWEKTASPAQRALGYEAMVADFTREHELATAGLNRCVEFREYDRQKLDSVYVSIFGLRRFCKMAGCKMPEFWESDDGSAPVRPPRQSQLDKAACQGIARTLWDENPNMTIAELVKHPAIQRNGNGAQYGPKTVHGWLAEVDPRAENAKTGRPRKDQHK